MKQSGVDEPIGVLCGGPSSEREISLRSGRAVHEALTARGLRAVLLELSESQKEIPNQIKEAKLGSAFVVLHGFFGEDGQVQALLEDLHIPYTGSSEEASRTAMNKWVSRQRWAADHLPVPKSVLVEQISDHPSTTLRVIDIGFPLMVKPVCQGSSVGMTIVDCAGDLPQAIAAAVPYGEEIILEEYIAGPEMTVGILDDQPLPVIQIVPKRRFYDYVAKYTPGMTEYLVPAPISPQTSRLLQDLAVKAHKALGCQSYSRVDFILSPERGPFLLELNTIPGMTATSLLPKAAAAVGIDFQELCVRMTASAASRNCLKGVS